MKGIIKKIVDRFNGVCAFFRKKDKFDNQRSATVMIVALSLCTITFYLGNELIKRISVFSLISIFFSLALLFCFDTEDKRIIKVTRGKCKTPRQLLKKLDHIAYVYGLFLFTIEMCIFIEVILGSIAAVVYGKFVIADITVLWPILMFIYTFLYFTYHIYSCTLTKQIECVQQRIQLYTAIGTTISFFMLIFGENHGFKIFITGTMLEFTWLQYIITKEKKLLPEVSIETGQRCR